jgi:predicted Zn-dependent peptidase
VISTVPRRSIQAYHRAMYAPAKIVVSAAGDVDHDRLVELVTRAAATRASERPGRPKLRAPLVRSPKPGLRFQRKDTEQYHVCLGALGISHSDRRRFVASILDAVLGGSASSRLFQEIREKRGMAYSVYTFASQYTDTGQIGVYLGTREDNLADALAIAVEQVAEIAAGGLTAAELGRAKENLKGRILLSMESTSMHMNRLGKSIVTDSEILPLEQVMAEVDAVEHDSVCELAALLLAPDRISLAGIGPSEERFLEAARRVSPELARAA